MATAALALAALRQPLGTQGAKEMALASGRALLTASSVAGGGSGAAARTRDLQGEHGEGGGGGGAAVEAAAAAPVALAVAKGRLHPEAAAALAMAGGGSFLPWRRRQRQRPSQTVSPQLCQDTAYRVIKQLWPSESAPAMLQTAATGARPATVGSAGGGGGLTPPAGLSPRGFEARLRCSAPVLRSLQQVSAVSPGWSRRVEREAWPAAHAYLYQEVGGKRELRRRYTDSMGRLMLKDWIRVRLPCRGSPPSTAAGAAAAATTTATAEPASSAAGVDLADNLFNRIVAFMA